MAKTTLPKSNFIKVFGENPYIKVLDFFLDNGVYDYSKTDVFEETGVSRVTLQEIFEQLESRGIIRETRAVGNAKMYQLNKENLLVKRLIKIDLMLCGIEEKQMVEA